MNNYCSNILKIITIVPGSIIGYIAGCKINKFYSVAIDNCNSVFGNTDPSWAYPNIFDFIFALNGIPFCILTTVAGAYIGYLIDIRYLIDVFFNRQLKS